MRAVSRLVGAVAISALVAGSAQAQGCLGFSSLQDKKMNIGGFAEFADGATSFGGLFHASLSSLYLGAHAGITSIDGVDESTKDFGVQLGIEKASGKIMWCPQGEFSYSKFGDASFKSIGGRLGVGYEAGGSSMKFIPFGQLGIAKFLDCDGCDTDIEFGAGLGIRFNNGMQISPQFKKNTAEGSEMVFGATVTFPFGSK